MKWKQHLYKFILSSKKRNNESIWHQNLIAALFTNRVLMCYASTMINMIYTHNIHSSRILTIYRKSSYTKPQTDKKRNSIFNIFDGWRTRTHVNTPCGWRMRMACADDVCVHMWTPPKCEWKRIIYEKTIQRSNSELFYERVGNYPTFTPLILRSDGVSCMWTLTRHCQELSCSLCNRVNSDLISS